MSGGARIRPATPADAPAVAAIYAPLVLDTPISFELDPPSEAEMGRRIEASGGRLPWLVCEAEEGVRGYAYASAYRARAAYRWSVEVSVYVGAARRARGVGSALYAALLSILELQGFHRAYAGITLPNPASVALHERMGFVRLGVYREVGFKQGVWHDVGWWERPLAAAGPSPREPRSFHALSGDEIAPHLARAGGRGTAAP